MLNWYTFTLPLDDIVGLTKAQKLLKEMLSNSGGMSGIALFYKSSNETKENQFYAAIPDTMPEMAEIVNRLYSTTACERPTGKELMELASGINDLDDYEGIKMKFKF